MHKSTMKAEQRKLEKLRERQEKEALRERSEEIKRAAERRMDLEHIRMIGEIRPGEDAGNLHDALCTALQFAKAFRLDEPAVVGETSLRDLERRIYYEAVRTGLFWLCDDETLSPRVSEKPAKDAKPFDEEWQKLEGSDQPITTEQYDAALAAIKGDGHGRN